MATIIMITGQQVTLAAVKTRAGIDADVIGTPTWTTSDSTILGLEPSVDGLTCIVKSKGPTGSATVTCNAQGSAPLSATHTVTVNATSTGLANQLAVTIQSPPS